MHVEFDWTFGVYRARFGHVWVAVRGERSWPSLKDCRDALMLAGLALGAKTDSRTWRVELAVAA